MWTGRAVAAVPFIAWPLLRSNTLLISVVTTLTGLQAFTQVYVLTQGGPDSATQAALYYA